MESLEYPHEPVMVGEILEFLVTDPDGIYVDGTLGTGGHSEAICRKISDKGRLICIDMDTKAIMLSGKRLSAFEKKITIRKSNFSSMDEVLKDLEIERVKGIVLDLGMSSLQLDCSGRGFSFKRDEPLDMRMDPEGGLTVEDMLKNSTEDEITKILRDFGEEKRARAISRAIVKKRETTGISSSLELAELIRSMSRNYRIIGKKDPATRSFQAFRIAVNREMENLKIFLEKVPGLLAEGGRVVVLTYHSLEDRMVKQSMAGWENPCVCPSDLPECVCGRAPLLRRLTRKALRPQESEIRRNPRARSAILRAAERI